jgi:cell wall-associated protease
MFLRLFLIAALLIPSMANAARVAIIDSGLDYKHKDLQGQIFINPNDSEDAVDNDNNGYVDDIYGWNFANNNNQIIDYKYLGTFSKDPYKFFEIQLKSFQGTVTQEEKDWVAAKRKDENFMKEMQKFGNFVHGTHVAGIALRDRKDIQAIGIKLIPTEVGASIRKILLRNPELQRKAAMGGFEPIVINLLTAQLAKQQMKLLTTIGQYTHGLKSDVANGSFGTGYAQAEMIIKLIYTNLFKKEPSAEDLKAMSISFLESLIKEGRGFVDAAPNTLFVFAAGNEGTNNDELPSSPTNIKTDNVISVAASFGLDALAVFSNYGVKMVDVAAPGVGILSPIPGDETLRVSGTSQAAPFVANVAAEIKNINPKLTPAQIKKIIVTTVDKKDFLSGKVASGGIVNPERAFEAARKSLSSPLASAMKSARASVSDVRNIGSSIRNVAGRKATGYVMPLYPMFQ